MTTRSRASLSLAALALAATVLTGCGDDGETAAGTDPATGDSTATDSASIDPGGATGGETAEATPPARLADPDVTCDLRGGGVFEAAVGEEGIDVVFDLGDAAADADTADLLYAVTLSAGERQVQLGVRDGEAFVVDLLAGAEQPADAAPEASTAGAAASFPLTGPLAGLQPQRWEATVDAAGDQRACRA